LFGCRIQAGFGKLDTSRRLALNNSFSKVAIWMVIALVLFTVFKQFDGRATTTDSVTYTQFMQDAQSGRINKVDIQGDTLYVTPDNGRPYSLTSPGDLWMVPELVKSGVQVSGKAREEPSFLTSLFISWFPMLLLIGVWVFFMRQMQGGGACWTRTPITLPLPTWRAATRPRKTCRSWSISCATRPNSSAWAAAFRAVS
jgi:hypothetical protein